MKRRRDGDTHRLSPYDRHMQAPAAKAKGKKFHLKAARLAQLEGLRGTAKMHYALARGQAAYGSRTRSRGRYGSREAPAAPRVAARTWVGAHEITVWETPRGYRPQVLGKYGPDGYSTIKDAIASAKRALELRSSRSAAYAGRRRGR
jgi:hypothetical protein